jgi:Icc-related predicted phosphoesterase
MPQSCFFVSDLHGRLDKYEKLFKALAEETPSALFMGGDLLPSEARLLNSLEPGHRDFINDYLVPEFLRLRERLGERYPRVFVILGNDDARFEEPAMLDAATRGVWEYAHGRKAAFGSHQVYGYAFVPPTPFLLKDWERYDVSRYVDPGCVSPEEGMRTVPVTEYEARYTTIAKDLNQLTGDDELSDAIFLFHTPPHKTNLDRAALDGRMVDHVAVDVHVGSIAVRQFIESRRPLVTLHGHVHESPRLTDAWRDRIGRTELFSAAHDGPELALVSFDPENPQLAARTLL